MAEKANPYTHLAKGNFLIASPDIGPGLFFRSVILLCEHSPAGSFGLIVNKPLHIDLPEEISTLGEMRNPRIQLRAGGPMQPNQMMLLHNNAREKVDQTLELAPQLFLGGDVQFLQKAMGDSQGPSVHLCFGYSGWTAGLLEREFLNGNWFICPASSRAVFESPPEGLWRTLLREMGGKYATLSMIPEDLSLN